MTKPIIERAFEIAASGECQTVTQIKAILKKERYSAIDPVFQGAGIRQQLKAIMTASRADAA